MVACLEAHERDRDGQTDRDLVSEVQLEKFFNLTFLVFLFIEQKQD